jgi:class 3 adenylate cyclase
MTATRRLAAILAADVAGYSRLIGADEGGTLQALNAIRAELVDPTIAAHHGRLETTERSANLAPICRGALSAAAISLDAISVGIDREGGIIVNAIVPA